MRDEGTFVCRGRLTSDVPASVRILCPFVWDSRFVWILCPFSPPQHPTPSLARSQVGTYLTRTALKKTESRPGSLQLIDLVTACRLCPARATRWLWVYERCYPFVSSVRDHIPTPRQQLGRVASEDVPATGDPNLTDAQACKLHQATRVQTRSSISAFMRGTVRRRWTMVRIVSQVQATELMWRLAAALVGVARKALDAISPGNVLNQRPYIVTRSYTPTQIYTFIHTKTYTRERARAHT